MFTEFFGEHFTDEVKTMRILLIGAISANGDCRPEFQSVLHQLASGATVFRHEKSLTTAGDAEAADVVVLAMSRPGEFSNQEICCLQEAWPSARFVYLLGAWCCGQKRVDPEFTRIPTRYLHEIQSGRELDQLTEASHDRRVATKPIAKTTLPLMAVYAETNSYRHCLLKSLKQAFPGNGLMALRFEDHVMTEGVGIVVWQTPLRAMQRAKQLREIQRRHPAAHIVALLTYPRGFEVQDFESKRVTVVSQPFHETDLLQAIERAGAKEHTGSALKMSA